MGEAIIDKMRDGLSGAGNVLSGLVDDSVALIDQVETRVTELSGKFDVSPTTIRDSLSSVALAANQQAIFDTTFAGQQFGRGRGEEVELLRSIERNTKDAADGPPGFPVR